MYGKPEFYDDFVKYCIKQIDYNKHNQISSNNDEIKLLKYRHKLRNKHDYMIDIIDNFFTKIL
jgi:tRNA A37 threonylcarbamoyladenosine dehydratase